MTLRVALASGTAAALVWGCTAQSTARPPATLNVAVQSDITGVYPDVRNESFTFAIHTAVFEGLTRFGHNLEPEPAVADRWDSPDDKTWIFHVRPGLRFSNREPVRAADVVASLRFARHLTALQYLLAALDTVEEISPEEVKVKTLFPFPVLLSHLPSAWIMPAAALTQTPVPAIGTGPFKLETWVPGKELNLVENPYFRGPRTGFDRVRLRVVPDGLDRIHALLEGRVDLVENVPLDMIPDLRRRAGVRVVVRPALKVLFLVLRTTEAHFSNPRVREAVDIAIDRDELVARALLGFGTPASELVPSAVLGYDASARPIRSDRNRARELLRAAGYPNGFEMRIEGPRDHYTNSIEIMNEVARQLGEIGIRLRVDAMPKGDFFASMDSPRWDLSLYGWSCETVHAGELLDELVRTPQEGGVNIASFSDPALDRVIDGARESPFLNERAHLLAEALKSVHETHALVPLVTENESFAYGPAVDWNPSLDMALRIPEVLSRSDALQAPTAAAR